MKNAAKVNAPDDGANAPRYRPETGMPKNVWGDPGMGDRKWDKTWHGGPRPGMNGRPKLGGGMGPGSGNRNCGSGTPPASTSCSTSGGGWQSVSNVLSEDNCQLGYTDASQGPGQLVLIRQRLFSHLYWRHSQTGCVRQQRTFKFQLGRLRSAFRNMSNENWPVADRQRKSRRKNRLPLAHSSSQNNRSGASRFDYIAAT